MTEAVTLRGPDGHPYAVAAAWIENVPDARIVAVLAAADVGALVRDELFHLMPVARPSELALDPTVPALLELRLAPEVPADDQDLPLADWLAADAARADSKSWFVARIAQPDASPPTDTPTLWHRIGVPAPDDDVADTTRAIAAFVREQHPELGDAGEILDAIVGSMFSAPAPLDVLDALAAVLTDAGAEPTRDQAALTFALRGEHGVWLGIAEVVGSVLAIYVAFPDEIPAERLNRTCDEICRFNCDRVFGGLDLDLRSGRAVFKVSQLVTGSPDPAILRALLDAALDGMDEAHVLLARNLVA